MMFKNKFLFSLYLIYRKFNCVFLKDTSPVVASIKITQKCNLHCSHCTWVNKIIDDLPLEKWKKIIDNIYKRGCFAVVIEGGEPTLRNDLTEIISYIKKKGMACLMFSNGTRKLPNSNVDAIWFSIDGTEKNHDIIRGSGTYKKIMYTLKQYPKRNTYSITTLSKVNAGEIENICKELSSTSLNGLIFNFMYPYKDVAHNALTKDERIECAKEILSLKNKYPKIVSSDSYLQSVGRKDKICYPWLLLLVTADGKITQGCTVDPTEEHNCDVCDMMCGLEATLGFELYKDSVRFWSLFNIFSDVDISRVPDWVLRLGRLNRK